MTKWLIALMVLLLLGCDTPVQKQQVTGPDPYKEQFVKTNRYMQLRHQDQIAAFVDRVGWDATVTSSGLWMVVVDSGSGPLLADEDRRVRSSRRYGPVTPPSPWIPERTSGFR